MVPRLTTHLLSLSMNKLLPLKQKVVYLKVLFWKLVWSKSLDYQEVHDSYYTDWADLKWRSVVKVWEQLQDKDSKVIKETPLDENP